MLPTEMVARKPRAQVPYCGRFTGQSASCSGSCRQPARYQGRAVSTGSRAGKMTDNPIILGGCGLARHDGELRGKGIAPVVSHFNQDQGWLCGTAEAVDCGANLCLAGQLSAYDVVLDARDLLARVIALHARCICVLYALLVHDQERATGIAPLFLSGRANLSLL